MERGDLRENFSFDGEILSVKEEGMGKMLKEKVGKLLKRGRRIIEDSNLWERI